VRASIFNLSLENSREDIIRAFLEGVAFNTRWMLGPGEKFLGRKLPFVAYNQGSIVHLETAGVMLLDFRHPLKLAKELKPRNHMMQEMGAAYMSQGIITLAGSRMYTSMADTDEIIDDAVRRFDIVLGSVEGA